MEETIAHEPPPKRALARWALRTGIDASRAHRANRAEPRIRRALAERIALRTIREAFGGRCKLFIVGAAPIAFEVLEFCEGIGIPIYEVYGMTESSSLISANRPGACKLGTVGRVVPRGEMMLADDGEVLYRGPNVFKGYLHNDEATAEAVDGEGWLHTGDIGEIDADGYLKIVDRKKDLIITAGGKNISPSNIENVLRQIPLVGEVLVHGDRRKYLTAILSLDKEELERFAAAAALPLEQRLRDFLQHHIDVANGKLSHFEQIQKWTVAPEAFSIEDGTLTPTLKVKRKAVEAKYALLLDEMYGDEPAPSA